MNFKKLTSLLLVAIFALAALAGCAPSSSGSDGTTGPTTTLAATGTGAQTEAPKDDITIRVGGLAGPTSIGLIKVMEDNEKGTSANKYTFSVDASADILTPKLVKGEVDIAAVPANLASVLYNNTDGKIKLLAINTLGVLYILTKNETVNSISDLKGKTIFAAASGKGAVPELSLRYILTQNNIDPDKDISIEWKSENSEIVAALKTSGGIALLPQPYVTAAQAAVENLEVALDMTEEWNRVGGGTEMLTGVLVVRSDFAKDNPEALAAFLTEYAASTEYVNQNVAEAAQLVEKFGIFSAAVAEAAIPHCNITFIGGADMKPLIEGYLGILFEQKPAAIGGKLPGDDFYYGT